jgi:hypothetical protein
MATLDTFKSKLVGGGARANQFRVTMSYPASVTEKPIDLAPFMIKAASLPGQTIDEIGLNYRGRVLYIDGDRTFDTWTTTVINDVGFEIRNSIEAWMNLINVMTPNTSAQNPSDYMVDLLVEQFDRKDVVIKSHKLINCWPTVLAPIDLNWDTRSEVETFDVTWRYTKFSRTVGDTQTQ